jgi:RES domain-containing protein
MTIVRLSRSRYSPKDATGSRRYGGRWNSPGNPVLYRPIIFTGEAALGKIESPVLSRECGDAWFHRTWFHRTKELRGAVIQTVPSVIVPREMNYLISPVHPRFGELVWSGPPTFQFDPRPPRNSTFTRSQRREVSGRGRICDRSLPIHPGFA